MTNTDTEVGTTYEIQWFIHNGWFHIDERKNEKEARDALENYWRKDWSSTKFRVIKKEVLDW
jgi:hypothetical protein